jgi:hypothetical protein
MQSHMHVISKYRKLCLAIYSTLPDDGTIIVEMLHSLLTYIRRFITIQITKLIYFQLS